MQAIIPTLWQILFQELLDQSNIKININKKETNL